MDKEGTIKLLKDQTCDYCTWLASFAKTKQPACLLSLKPLPENKMCDRFARKVKEDSFYGPEKITIGDEHK
jgi:hypothetical protein